MKMDFGIGTGRNEPIWEIAGMSHLADELGFTHLTFIDSQNLSRDVYSMMAIAALNTRSIKIGHGVTNPVTRHPSVTANATATVNELSGGRAFIGIGVGFSAVYTMDMNPRPQQERIDAIKFFRKYMAGEEAEFKGAKMHSEWIRKPVPIYMGANGPRSLKLAGEYGDGAIITGVHPELIKWKMEMVHKGAEKAGRDPSKVDIWARTMCFVAESKEKARREVASYAATNATGIYKASFARKTPELEELHRRMERLEPGISEELRRVGEAYDSYQHERTDAPHGSLATQRIIDMTMLTGTPDDICEQITKLGDIGIKTVSMTFYTIINKKAMLKEIADKILPSFRN